VGAFDKAKAQRMLHFGQVSGYRLDLTQALIAKDVGKLLPQMTKARNVRKRSRHYN
jgi:hypothetical protein